jgi:transcriptional regulator with XRE-family HTH domain
MSLELFSKNLRYKRKQLGFSGSELIRQIELLSGQRITRGRYGAWEERRAYCPTPLLPFLCQALKVKDVISFLTVDLENQEKEKSTSI